jgi:taurine--2-oxoglutarate transaminase
VSWGKNWQICPGDFNKAFFTLCGATSIENAIKLARLYTGRHKIITRYQSYHGSSMVPFLPAVIHADYP